MRRVFFFLLTNFAVLLLMNLIIRLFGLDLIARNQGLDLRVLSVFALIWGMSGSVISLLLSKWMALNMTGATVIDQPSNRTERWLLETVSAQAEMAGIGTPDLAIYDSPEPNAFATGARRDSALVAVSTGLLDHMDSDQVEAVLAHEISHISNGDMVTLTLIQGVLNAFVIFLARIIGFVVESAMQRSSDDSESRGSSGAAFWLVTMISEIFLGVLASIIVLWFSRMREFRADAGGAKLAGRGKMIAALEGLRRMDEGSNLPKSLSAFGLSGSRSGFARLFMTHPPLEERIAALRASAIS